MKNAIVWFEIPVADFERACRFYQRILDAELRVDDTCSMRMAILPYSEPGVGGSLIEMESMRPSAHGVCVYLDGGEDLSAVLGRVEAAGGKVVQPKRLITEEIGYIALFTDSEGNTIGLHSQK